MNSIFISGTAGFGTKTINSLPESVKNYIDMCVEHGYQILIGDCIGVDTLVQEYINTIGYNNVVIYCSGSRCRNIVNSDWHIKFVKVPYGVKGRDYFAVKDKAMAHDADYALVVWDGKSKGTYNNINNMKAQNKPVIIYRLDKEYFENN